MDAPNLVVVPPTPFHAADNSTDARARTAPPTPELVQASSIDQERSSSETTIVTIYSMYGEQAVSPPSHSPLKQAANGSAPFPSYHDDSIQIQHSHSGTSYYSASSESRPHSKRSTPIARISATVTNSPGRDSTSSDSSSAYGGFSNEGSTRRHRRTTSQPRGPRDRHSRSSSRSLANPRASSGQQQDPQLLSPTPTAQTPPRSSRHSSRISLNGNGTSTPNSNDRSPRQRLSPHSHSSQSPGLSPVLPSPPPIPDSFYQTHSLGRTKSKISIAPSEGEDPDAWHVRSTYAHLDLLGVKGDGYEEGVERTRARVGQSRASTILAEEALGTEEERKRDLSAQEVQMLAGLDRYGFFSTPSHDRLVQLPSSAFAKQFARIPNPATNGPPSPTALSSPPPPNPLIHEIERLEKWHRMLEPLSRDQGGNIVTWGIKASKERKLRHRIYKGIPDRWRSAAWQLLMSRFSKTDQDALHKYADDYQQALERPSEYDIQIDLDVPRTISGHFLFRTRYGHGQRSLFHVLHSFSLRCEQCGYVQGMGPIAAMLLCYFEPERAYAFLVLLHDAYQMHSIFSPGFPGLLESIYVQERLMEEMLPNVFEAFKKHMISTTSYATKWYITLFANSVPFQTLLRLWDAFLLEGPDLFVVVATAIVWAYRDHITSAQASFETILSLLSSFFVPEDENVLLFWVGKVLEGPELRGKMQGWRQDWKELVKTGKDAQALI